MTRYWRALVTLYVYHDDVECFHSLSNVLVTHQQVVARMPDANL